MAFHLKGDNLEGDSIEL